MRYKPVFIKNTFYSSIHLLTYIVVGIILTPVMLDYFDKEYFVFIMLVHTLSLYVGSIKLGIPEFLAISIAKQKDDVLKRVMIKKSFLIITFLAFCLLVFLALSLLVFDWGRVLSLSEQSNRNILLEVLYVLIFFALVRAPLELVFSVYIGFHDIYLEKAYQSLSLILNLLLVFYIVENNHSIVFYAWTTGILELLLCFVGFLHALLKYKLSIFENILIKKKQYQLILKGGIGFFQLHMTQILIWSSGLYLINFMLAIDVVASYVVIIKAYTLFLSLYVLLGTLISPMYGKLIISNHFNLIEDLGHISLIVMQIIGGGIWIVSTIFMEDIILLWLSSGEFYIGDGFIFFMNLFFYMLGFVYSYITAIICLGFADKIIKIRWTEYSFGLFISIVCIYFFGVIGIPIALSIACLAISIRLMPGILAIEGLRFEIKYNVWYLITGLPLIIVFSLFAKYYFESILIKAFIAMTLIMFHTYMLWYMSTSSSKKNLGLFINIRKSNIL